jgi:hypothetical protein
LSTHAVDVLLSTFDGWGLANGQSFNISYFELSDDIPKVFKKTSNNTFVVPNLNEKYIKFSTDLSSNSTTTTNGRTTLLDH